VKSVIFDGTEQSVIDILAILPGKAKAIRTYGKCITIPTGTGKTDTYIGDTVCVDGEEVWVEQKGAR
jgi:hypothetical protein